MEVTIITRKIWLIMSILTSISQQLVATPTQDVVYVHNEYGSTKESCGPLFDKCKHLHLAVRNCKAGGKIVMLSDQKIASQIFIKKNVSIIGVGDVMIKGHTQNAVAFRVGRQANISLFNLNFKDVGVASIQSSSSVYVAKCSMSHSVVPLNLTTVTRKGPHYRRTDGGLLVYSSIKHAYFDFDSANSSFLQIISSTFTDWNHGYVLKSSQSGDAFKRHSFRLQIAFENCIFVNTLGLQLEEVVNSTLSVKNCTFYNITCTAIDVWGTKGTQGNSLYVSGSSFIRNKRCVRYYRGHYRDFGGAIRTKYVSFVYIYQTIFKKLEGIYGGAISASFVSDQLIIKKCRFHRNRATKSGGDVYASYSISVIENCRLSQSRGKNGGSINILIASKKSATFSNCSFTNCKAGSYGGAVRVDPRGPPSSSTLVLLARCEFKQNKAKMGGAITIGSQGEFESCIFDSNSGEEGGAISMLIVGKYRKKIKSALRNCVIKRNYGNKGGALFVEGYYHHTPVAVRRCEFLNNHAMLTGQTVYSVGNIHIEDTTFKTVEKFTVPHLYLRRKISLSNVTIQLHRDSRDGLAQKTKGVHFEGESIRLSKGFTFLCPTNFNVDDLKNGSTKIGKKVRVGMNAWEIKYRRVYRYFTVGCTACQTAMYHIHSGRLFLEQLSKKVPPKVENAKCMSCPVGVICAFFIKATDNFWGHVTKKSKLSMQICPSGFCCSDDTVPCISYDTCAVGRKGTLCGTCSEGFKQNFFGSNCIPKGDPCDPSVFVAYFVMYTLAYSVVFISITNVKGILIKMKTLLGMKKPANDDEEDIANEDTFSIAGFVQIVILFIQVASLLRVKFHGMQQGNGGDSDNSLSTTIMDIFNFRFVVYQRVCPSDSLTLPQKEILLLGMKMSSFLILFTLVFIHQVIKMLIRRCKSFHQSSATSEDQPTEIKCLKAKQEEHLDEISINRQIGVVTLSFVSMVKCTFIKLLKMYYTPISTFALSMVYCVKINNEHHLYVSGDHICYTGWQFGILVFLLPCLLLFPLCFEIAIRLLKDRQVTSWQFVLASLCPYYSIALHAWRRMRQKETDLLSTPLLNEEELLRSIILEGEEQLFKEVGNRSLSWTVVQFYRAFGISLLSTFVTNPIYKQLAYGALIMFFIGHDVVRKPYKNQYLNYLQCASSGCLIFILLCNFIPAVSYILDVQGVPFIGEVVKVLRIVELIVYSVVPLSLPVWKLKTHLQSKREAAENE